MATLAIPTTPKFVTFPKSVRAKHYGTPYLKGLPKKWNREKEWG